MVLSIAGVVGIPVVYFVVQGACCRLPWLSVYCCCLCVFVRREFYSSHLAPKDFIPENNFYTLCSKYRVFGNEGNVLCWKLDMIL